MIISENPKPTLEEFRGLMCETDRLLNIEAEGREEYYSTRNGTLLEEDVYDALIRSSKNTPFEGSIQLVSGASFPDIIANRFYGVEVKSTNKNHWKSIGSSILESTRVEDVERIFLTFGKLSNPIEFRSRPYEECLYGISVTHYPRYQIDMDLSENETIFDKMGIPYDEFRKMENPVEPVARYYKSQLKEGERLWWAPDSNLETQEVPITIKLWTSLSCEEKNRYTVKGYTLFPEILRGKSVTKYNRFALWLAAECGIIDTNVRDQFSAGGKKDIITPNGVYERMPAAFKRIQDNWIAIAETILSTDENILCEYWGVSSVEPNRIRQWCKLVASEVDEDIGYLKAYEMLKSIFGVV